MADQEVDCDSKVCTSLNVGYQRECKSFMDCDVCQMDECPYLMQRDSNCIVWECVDKNSNNLLWVVIPVSYVVVLLLVCGLLMMARCLYKKEKKSPNRDIIVESSRESSAASTPEPGVRHNKQSILLRHYQGEHNLSHIHQFIHSRSFFQMRSEIENHVLPVINLDPELSKRK